MCEDCIIAQLDGREDSDKNRTILSDNLWSEEELEQSNIQRRVTPPGVIKCPECRQVKLQYYIDFSGCIVFLFFLFLQKFKISYNKTKIFMFIK